MKKEQQPNYYWDKETKQYKLKPTKIELGKKIKCLIYARVSDQKQVDEGNGIENQIITCEKYAQDKEFEIIEVFKDEGISGRLRHRNNFDMMINKLKQENKSTLNIDYVLISEYSRFSRNEKLGVSELMEDEIKETGCHIIFVRGELSTNNKQSSYQLDLEKIKAKYESVENSERTTSRMTGRIYLGYRTFPVPAGYEYEKVSIGHKKTQSYVKKIEGTIDIVKEGLEGYANGRFQTHTQLLDFFNSKNLKSNYHSPKVGKLKLTFIQRMLEIDKLYFYAGYIMYPKWGILEPIKAKHEAIISYDTLYKILQVEEKRGNKKHGIRKDSSDLYPLRGILFCPNCNNPLTSMIGKGNGGNYNYYICNRKECNKHFNIPVEKIHKDFLDLLNTIKPNEDIIKLLDKIFCQSIDKSKNNKSTHDKYIKQEIEQIEREMEKKLNTISNLSNITMIRKLEEERGKLNERKNTLEETLENKFLSEIEIKDLYERYKTIITNPIAIWEIGNKELKMMLIMVLFGGKLYYEKNLGFQTEKNQDLLKDLPIFLSNLFTYGAHKNF